MVWRADGSARYGQRVSRTGALDGAAFLIGTGSEPAVAYNASDDQYLVVWSLEGTSGIAEVYGRRISWLG